jgi:hypothetical protein
MLIDVIVTKPFGGLETGKITQLKESAFNDLFAQGYCKKVEETKTVPEPKTEIKKGIKK